MSINGETFLTWKTNEHELITNRHTKVCEEIPNFATSKRKTATPKRKEDYGISRHK